MGSKVQLRTFQSLYAIPSRNGLMRPKRVRGSGIKMVNMGELFAYDRIRSQHMERVPVSDSESERFLIKEGDLLFARSSLTLEGSGKCAIVYPADEPRTFESHIIRVRLDEKQACALFYYYFFRSSHGKAAIQSITEQVSAAGIRASDLAKLQVPHPHPTEQQRIADVLGGLDDKIELNRRMNRTLEKMAAALFKSWFIDFDPVHAKAEGQDPNLPPDIANLFPDTFQDSELGPIPQGWEPTTVGKEFNLTMGQSPPGDTYNESREGSPFFQGRRDFGFRYPTNRVYCTAPTRHAARGDTLMSVRAPVGDVNMAIDSCSIGRGVAAARHKSTSVSYTYYAFRSLRERLDVYNGEGTVFGSISQKDLRAILWLGPSDSIVSRFEQMVAPIDQRIEMNEIQDRRLSSLRDTLLPKLLSGEIEIPEVEAIAEEMGL